MAIILVLIAAYSWQHYPFTFFKNVRLVFIIKMVPINYNFLMSAFSVPHINHQNPALYLFQDKALNLSAKMSPPFVDNIKVRNII